MQKILKKPVSNESFLQLINLLPALDMHNGPWIAGGSARRLWLDQDWNTQDVDVFFTNDLSRHAWCSELGIKWNNSNNVQPINQIISFDQLFCASPVRSVPDSHSRDMELVITTDNADTYNLYYSDNDVLNTTSLQLIKHGYHENICKLWDDFDFTISCFATDGREIWAWQNSVQDALDMQININNVTKRDNLALRLVKHHAYGFKIDDQLLMEAADLISRGEFQWPMNY